MNKVDLDELSQRLHQLADVPLVGKPPSSGGLLVWFDVLKEASFGEVLSVLTDWPKTHGRMPLPNEVLKLTRERISTRIEEQAKLRAREARELTFDVRNLPANTEIAQRELAKIKAILATPRPSKRAWIDKILARHAAGDPTLSLYAVKLAKEVQASFRSKEETEVESVTYARAIY